MTFPLTQSPTAPPVPRSAAVAQQTQQLQPSEPVLCNHCGRTATNGISCQGYCVADSEY
ncbi:hypothetical protein [Synechococcus sp. 1G10]|uniref:hypothetical protein n=1 Tax=Synechococcus sp. 1G10 TaxID=2025605 RepID=UPI001303AB06|nr:hypothetical protein [Synechococcus sp. 1G10]